MNQTSKRVYVAGHNGMVGSAICRLLSQDNSIELITISRSEVDLTNQMQVSEFFNDISIDEIYLAAARVGGIHANNTYPAEFIYENLMIQSNVIHAAHLADVPKLLFLGSSCIYPRQAEQPMKEDALLTGPLEPTNAPYAIAKIAGIQMCASYKRQYNRQYRSVMPTNLYGPGDNYTPENNHVIPSLVHKSLMAKRNNTDFSVWGTGQPLREFLHCDDLAAAAKLVQQVPETEFVAACGYGKYYINVGSGEEISIKQLAQTIAKLAGYHGEIRFDTDKPDGPKRKLIDSTNMKKLGWAAKIPLQHGLKAVIAEQDGLYFG